ncbi:hypothetical protein [Gilvimarinus polysaccharolyticus]|uniref:hypothetical protein n=1 Tax=Gilvimarinus polysaccharolyticus TaxID=863921 RepID=UPI000673C3D2|nr:hypothetical protein [Gilvimarinus polysaccharolyticus]
MKLIFLTLIPILPILAFGECKVEVESIKPSVKEILAPLHEQNNYFISKSDFKEAYDSVISLKSDVDLCEEYFMEYEWENYHFSRWGEKSDEYFKYSLELTSITMQLKAAYESFEIGIFRPFVFKTGKWEEVANEFYDEKI